MLPINQALYAILDAKLKCEENLNSPQVQSRGDSAGYYRRGSGPGSAGGGGASNLMAIDSGNDFY